MYIRQKSNIYYNLNMLNGVDNDCLPITTS